MCTRRHESWGPSWIQPITSLRYEGPCLFPVLPPVVPWSSSLFCCLWWVLLGWANTRHLGSCPVPSGPFVSCHLLSWNLCLPLWRCCSWTSDASRMSSSPVDQPFNFLLQPKPSSWKSLMRHFLWCVQRGGIMLLRSLSGQRYTSTMWIASKGQFTFKKSSYLSRWEWSMHWQKKMNPATLRLEVTLETIRLTAPTLLPFLRSLLKHLQWGGSHD